MLTSEDVGKIAKEADSVTDEQGKQRVRSIMDLISLLNRNKKWKKEMMGMGAFLDLFKEEFEEKDRQIKSLSEQLQNQSEQLQDKDEQLQSNERELKEEKEENSRLRKEIEELKKQIKIAML